MAHAIHPSRSALSHSAADLRCRADKLITFGESPAEREAGALLHELLDGYTSPARADEEVRELKAEIRELTSEIDAAETDKKIARQQIARALATLERVRTVCADEAKLDETIELLNEIDLG